MYEVSLPKLSIDKYLKIANNAGALATNASALVTAIVAMRVYRGADKVVGGAVQAARPLVDELRPSDEEPGSEYDGTWSADNSQGLQAVPDLPDRLNGNMQASSSGRPNHRQPARELLRVVLTPQPRPPRS